VFRLKLEHYVADGYHAYGCALGWFGWVSLWPRRWAWQRQSTEFYHHVRIGPFMWTRIKTR
jgi:hypothetical protein